MSAQNAFLQWSENTWLLRVHCTRCHTSMRRKPDTVLRTQCWRNCSLLSLIHIFICWHFDTRTRRHKADNVPIHIVTTWSFANRCRKNSIKTLTKVETDVHVVLHFVCLSTWPFFSTNFVAKFCVKSSFFHSYIYIKNHHVWRKLSHSKLSTLHISLSIVHGDLHILIMLMTRLMGSSHMKGNWSKMTTTGELTVNYD